MLWFRVKTKQIQLLGANSTPQGTIVQQIKLFLLLHLDGIWSGRAENRPDTVGLGLRCHHAAGFGVTSGQVVG